MHCFILISNYVNINRNMTMESFFSDLKTGIINMNHQNAIVLKTNYILNTSKRI